MRLDHTSFKILAEIESMLRVDEEDARKMSAESTHQ